MFLILNERICFHEIDESNPKEKNLIATLRRNFSHENPDWHKARRLGFSPKCSQYINTWRWGKVEFGGFNSKVFSVPRGRFREVYEGLVESGVSPKVVDKRYEGPTVSYPGFPGPNFKLRDYQEEAIKTILDWETCLIEGAPASGKTEILLGAIAKVGLKALILVHDKRLFNQWIRRIEKRLGVPQREIGTIGGGKKFKVGDRITVAMQISARNNLHKLLGQFGFVGLDEAHHAAAKTYLAVLDALESKYRVGVSATIKRQDSRHFLTHDLFGPVAYRIDRQYLEDRGDIQQVDVIVVPTDFEYDYMNRQGLKGMCATGDIMLGELSKQSRQKIEHRLTLNGPAEIQAAIKQGKIEVRDIVPKDRRNICSNMGWEPNDFLGYTTEAMFNKARNRLIVEYVKDEIKKGNRCLLFTSRRDHCEIWQKGLKHRGIEAAIFWGVNTKREERIIEKDIKRLKSGDLLVGIGTIVDEALNFPSVEVGFVLLRTAQHKGKLEQRAGRLARICSGKHSARLYYFWDHLIEQFQDDIKVLRKLFRSVRVADRGQHGIW